jgi:ribonuclease HI
VDASTSPDQQPQVNRNAGIGIIFHNPMLQPEQKIEIQAIMTTTQSVIMAEAAALALAANIADKLHFNNISFLSDCSQLVHFLNSEDHTNPPDWRMQTYTQVFDNFASNHQANIYRISRSLNSTADALAREALQHVPPSQQVVQNLCFYYAHDHQCPIMDALTTVSLNNVRVLAATCC